MSRRATIGSFQPLAGGRCLSAASRRLSDNRGSSMARASSNVPTMVARQLPDWGQPGAHERAHVTVATMVGTLLLARAIDDPRLSDSLREAALKHLPPASG